MSQKELLGEFKKSLVDKELVFEVDRIPFCDVPNCLKVAWYDGRTRMGYWAYMCQEHFEQYGIGLGPGKGQRLVERGV